MKKNNNRKIIAAIIGMGIGERHLEAIDKYNGSKVSLICEKNKNKIDILKKKYQNEKSSSNYGQAIKGAKVYY